jgi:hypothetical protein
LSVPSDRASTAPKRRSWRRRARPIGWALLALEAVYLVGAHVFLWSDLAPDVINRRPEKLRVEWHSVFTPLPGLVRARGVDVRGQNRSNQWHARVDRTWVWIDLVRLPRRVFRTLALDVRGAEFRLRPNVFEGEREAVATEALAPIPGFELPNPLPRESLAPRRPQRRPWRLRFGGMRVRELRELWLGRYRLRSETSLSGDLDFAVRGLLESQGLRLRVLRGVLEDGGEAPVADHLAVDAALRMEPFDPGDTPVAEILDGLEGELEVRAAIASLGFLDPFLARSRWLDLDADGELEARVLLDDGAILPGTRFRVEAEPLVARLAGNRVVGVGVIEGLLEEAPRAEDGASKRAADGASERAEDGASERAEDAAAVMDVRFPSFTVETPGGRTLVRGDGFTIHLETRQREIRTPSDLVATIDLPSSQIVDLGALDEFLPAPAALELSGGSGTLRLHLTVDQPSRSGRGKVEATVEDAVGRFVDTRFRGDLKLAADLDRIDATGRSLTVAPAVLRLDDVAVDAGDGSDWASVPGDWWGELVLEQGRFDFAQGWRARGDVALRLRDNLPVLAVFVERKAFLGWFYGLLEAEDIEGSAGVDIGKRHLRVDDLRIESDPIEIAGDLALSEPKRKEGLLFARFRGFSVAVELFADGRRDWKLTRSRRWFEERRAERRAKAPVEAAR